MNVYGMFLQPLGNDVVTSFALNTLDDARIHICHLENVVSAELP